MSDTYLINSFTTDKCSAAGCPTYTALGPDGCVHKTFEFDGTIHHTLESGATIKGRSIIALYDRIIEWGDYDKRRVSATAYEVDEDVAKEAWRLAIGIVEQSECDASEAIENAVTVAEELGWELDV